VRVVKSEFELINTEKATAAEEWEKVDVWEGGVRPLTRQALLRKPYCDLTVSKRNLRRQEGGVRSKRSNSSVLVGSWTFEFVDT
jgi:hypothetical protein